MPSPIVKGNKIAKGGARPGAGRPKRGVATAKETAAALVRRIIEAQAAPIAEAYVSLAHGKGKIPLDPSTVRHAIDKLLPDIDASKDRQPIAIQIVVESSGASTQGEGSDRTIDIGGD